MEAEVVRLADERNLEVILAVGSEKVIPVCPYSRHYAAYVRLVKLYRKELRHQRWIDRQEMHRYNVTEAEFPLPRLVSRHLVDLLAKVRDAESLVNCHTPCGTCACQAKVTNRLLCRKCLKFIPLRRRGRHEC